MRFIFFSDLAFEKWHWEACDRGIGGSETSHIQMAWRIARRGHEVITFAPLPDDVPSGSEWRGTKWYRIEDVDWSLKGWWMLYRCPQRLDEFSMDHPGQGLALMFQDWDYPTLRDDRLKKLDRAVVLCRAHERWLLQRRPDLIGKTWVTRNAVRCDLIAEVEAAGIPKRNPKRIMFTSSPDRGLKTALKIFKRAKEFVPDLEMYISYGFNNINKLIEQGAESFRVDRDQCMELVEETGAKFLGRLTQPELYRELFKTGILVYVSSFSETGYISGLEAMSMGAVPIFSPIWAQGENINFGIPITGHPDDFGIVARAAAELVRLATNPELQESIRVPMMAETRKRWDWECFVPGWIRAAEIDLTESKTDTCRGVSVEVHVNQADNADEAAARDRWLDLKPGDVFLDIGACDGSWSLPAAAMGATVVAVEPSCAAMMIDLMADKNWNRPIMGGLGEAAYLLSKSHGDIQVIRAVCAAEPSDTMVNFPDAPEYSGWLTPASKSRYVVPVTTIDELVYGKPMSEENAANAGKTEEISSGILPQDTTLTNQSSHINAVPAKPIGKVDFIKIDVEGAEVDVLRGALRTLEEYRPRLMIEVHTETVPGKRVELADVSTVLARFGYKYSLYELSWDGKKYYHLYCEPTRSD
jgi:glycosyltransferase involved in cell wall biosynthesis